MAKNVIEHVEWGSTNLERTRHFLTQLFGWSFESYGETYLLFRTSGQIGGGIMLLEEVRQGNSPVVYVTVDSIQATLEQAQEFGGGVAVPKAEIPGMGWFAHLTDPDNNVIGLFEHQAG